MAKNTVIVSVLGDTAPLKKSMDGVGGSVSGLLGKMAPIAGAIAAAFSVKAIVDFGKKAVGLASDLEQSIGGLGAVFKEGVNQMLGFSQGAAMAIGLTRDQYNVAATLIGTSLKAAGVPMEELGGKTNDLMTRAADLSSMFGGTVSEAVAAMGSGLRGEFEPLRRYGIALNQAEINAKAMALSGKTVASELTAQDKALATNALIFEKSTDAAGNFARESDTLAGKQERLKAIFGNVSTTLGGILLPAVSLVTGKALEFVAAFTESEGFAAFVQTATDFFTGLASGGNPLSDMLGPLAQFLGFLSPLGVLLNVIKPLLPQIAAAFGQIGGVLAGALLSVLPAINSVLSQVVSILSEGLAQLLPVLIPLVLSLADTFGGILAAALPIVVSLMTMLMPIISTVIGVVVQLVAALAPLIATFAELIGTVLGALMPVLVAVLKPILGLIPPLIDMLMPAIMQVIAVITFIANLLTTLFTGAIEIVSALLRGDFTGAMQAVEKMFKGIWESIVTFFKSSMTNLGDALAAIGAFFAQVWTNAVSFGADAARNLIRFFTGWVDFMREIPGKIMAVFSGAFNWLVSIGQDIVNGLLKGIKDMAGRVFDFVKNMAADIAKTFTKVLGIASPSRVFKSLGRWVVKGLENGLDAPNRLASLMSGLAGQVEGGFSASLNVPTGYRAALAGGGNSYSVTVQAVAPNAEVGRAVVEAIEEFERLGGSKK